MKILCSILALLASVSAHSTETLSTRPFTPGTTPAVAQLAGKLRMDFKDADIELIDHAFFLSDVVEPIPEIQVILVGDGRDLIPVTRGLRITDNPIWDYFVGPGKSWQEGKVSVASLPLTLIYRPVNCSHNGTIRIEYNSTQVTDTRILVGQEICHLFRVDISGRGKTDYEPQEPSVADEVRAAWLKEQEHRLPTYSLEEFVKDYPAADLELFRTGLPDDHDLSTFGIYYKDKHYNAGCVTRHGPYSYCDQMLMTSFSTAKTAYAGIALMAIAQEFGEEVYNTTIASLLPETDQSKGRWDNVTLNHLGDMASGNFSNSEPMADPGPGQFYRDSDRSTKLAAAFSWPNARTAGEFFVYQTADTFIQINAMDALLRQHKADITDSFDYLVSRVLKPLNTQPEVWFSRRTRDNGVVNSGTAFGGMGMWWTADAIVKVARFMLLDKGAINGRQILHSGALSSTMQLDSSDRGVQTRFYNQLYNNNTWALPARLLGEQFSCDPYVTMMSGVSGVRVFMMPNGLIYYYFNDAQAFPTVEPILAADKLQAFCEEKN